MLNNKLTHDRVVAELIDSQKKLYSENWGGKILQILMDNCVIIRNIYLLQWVPDQGEDIFYILVDAKSVAIIEVPRLENELSSSAFCQQISLEDYLKRRLPNNVRRRAKVALKMINAQASQEI